MTDERLARLRRDNEPLGDHLSGLTADEVGELLDEIERLRSEPLHDEYGIRAEYISTRLVEFTVADNLGDALAALAEFDEKHSERVVRRCLIQRPVGDWHKLDDAGEQQPEDGDRG